MDLNKYEGPRGMAGPACKHSRWLDEEGAFKRFHTHDCGRARQASLRYDPGREYAAKFSSEGFNDARALFDHYVETHGVPRIDAGREYELFTLLRMFAKLAAVEIPDPMDLPDPREAHHATQEDADIVGRLREVDLATVSDEELARAGNAANSVQRDKTLNCTEFVESTGIRFDELCLRIDNEVLRRMRRTA